MQTAARPEPNIEDAAARLASLYKAQGDLELYFIRQIAAAQITVESLNRAIHTLSSAADPNDARIDRLSRAKAREQRQEICAIKELRTLQDRRNILARFPDQTKDCPPLADHTLFIGERPKIKPIPVLLRGRLHSPVDHNRMRVSEPDPTARANGRPDIKRLVPDC
ncbi:MAG: hypothetical protein ABI972_31420 [Acidobacteriota bacterium]